MRGQRSNSTLEKSRGDGAAAHRRQSDGAAPMPTQSTQSFGTVKPMPIALEDNARRQVVEMLTPLLADTMTIRDLYKKHHWQISGPTFYQLHLLFDKHFAEQQELIDEIAERIQMLGGVSLAMAHDVAETTRIPRPPRDREAPKMQIQRLLEAHEIILEESRRVARDASTLGDDGTNDLIVSDVIRINEAQVWFVSEHLVETTIQ